MAPPAARHGHARGAAARRRLEAAAGRQPRGQRRRGAAELPAVLAGGVAAFPERRAAYLVARSGHSEPLEVRDDPLGAGGEQLVALVAGRHSHGAHARAASRLDAHHRVLEHDASGRRHAEPRGGEAVDLGIGLAEGHVVGGHDHTEPAAEADLRQEPGHVLAGRGGAHRRGTSSAARCSTNAVTPRTGRAPRRAIRT